MKQITQCAVLLTLIILAAVGCDASGSSTTTSTDPGRTFSVTHPASWRSKSSAEGEYNEVVLSSRRAPDVWMAIRSGPVPPEARGADSVQVIDAMMSNMLSHLRSQGNRILNVGRSREFVPGHPAFVVTSATSDGRQIVTAWGTVARGRMLDITAITENTGGSEQLASTMRSVVESVEIHL